MGVLAVLWLPLFILMTAVAWTYDALNIPLYITIPIALVLLGVVFRFLERRL